MKKHNGHSNGHVQSKVGHAPSGLQATLAKKIAHKLAQAAGQQRAVYSSGQPMVRSQRMLRNGHVQGIGLLALGQYATQVSPNSGGTAADASGVASVAVGNDAHATNNGAVGMGSGAVASGLQSIALGNNAATTGNYSSYVGTADSKNQFKTGTQAFAGGYNVNASGNVSVAIGSLSKATRDLATSLGAATNTTGLAATAIGYGATAGGDGSIAIGGSQTLSAKAAALHSIAIGEASVTSGAESVAVGENANVSGTNSVAIGQLAKATNKNAVALGGNSVTTADNSVSVGSASSGRRVMNMAAGVLNTDAVNVNQLKPVITALGGGASIDPTTGAVTGPSYTLANGGVQTTLSGALTALDKAVSDGAGGSYDKYMVLKTGTYAADLDAQAGNSATALGPNANANAQSAVALGGNTIAGYNAIAIGTLSQATGQNSSAVGLESTANAIRSSAFGAYASASADSATSVGNSANASGVAATVLGQAAAGVGNYSVAVGIQANGVGSNTIAIGAGAISGKGSPLTDGDGNIVIGSNALVDNIGAGAVVIGRNAFVKNDGGDPAVTGAGAIALGDGASAYGNNSTAIGRGAYTGFAGGVALGDSAKVLSGTASVALGANTLADADMTVSVGNKSTNLRHRIVNMDAGQDSYDAVNINQLQPVVTALGGGASIDPATGAVTGPTYTLANGGVQTTLSGALSALDKAVSDGTGGSNPYFAFNPSRPEYQAEASGEGALALGGPAYALGKNSVAIGINSAADADDTMSVGSVVIKRKIVNVARGDVSAASFDAVTGAQLDETNHQVTALQDALNNSGVIDPGSGVSLAVTYSSATKDAIQLGSGRPVEIMNVATAIAPSDAVNLSQLTGAVDGLRNELSPSVAYLKVNSTGADATASGSDAVAIGASAIASSEDSLALGLSARASADQAVALGSDSLADAALSVSIGNGPLGLKRKLVNLQAGASADDAVAINQLQPVVTALGGGAAIDPLTGEVTPPRYTLANGGVQTSLEDALGALDQAVSESAGNNPYLAVNSNGPDAAASGNESVGLGSGASASGNNAVAIGANAMAEADDTVSIGKLGGERKLVNVAKGDVSTTSTDAVNGSQLDDTNQAVSELQDALTGSGLIDPGTGTSLAVTYSNASKNIVVLGSGTPVEIMNVADGLAASDAATVGQVTSAVDGLRSELANNLKYVRVNAAGVAANAGGTNSVAIGSSANATDAGTVAIGIGARAAAANCVALGQNSVARTAGTVSVGDVGKERKIVNVLDGDISDGSTEAVNGGQLFNALGALTTRAGILDVSDPQYAVEGVTGDNTASLNGADPNSYSAMAVGVKSVASGADAAAFGLNAIAQSDHSVAIGSSAQTGAEQDYSVALGSSVFTNGIQAIAMGANVQANANNALVIGNNGAFAVGPSSIAIGDSAKDRGESGVAIGKDALAAANTVSAIAVGTGATVATGLSNAIALGVSASVTAGANGGVALGQGAVANRGNAVSLGNTTGNNPVGARQIINLSAGTQATDAVNVTQLQGVTTALGGGASVGTDGSIQPPTYNVGGTPYSDVGGAINAAANMVDPNAVAYDDAAKDTITLDGNNGTLLTNVRDGNVAADSMDAINGSQMYGTADSIATSLGGGAKVNTDGSVSPPLYVINNTRASDVGEALTNLYDVVNGQLADSGLVDQNGRAIAAVTYDGALQNRVTLGGTGAASPVTVSNVSAGDVSSATSTDAVNGGQLYATNLVVGNLKDALDQGGVLDPATGASLAVTYADANKAGVSLGTAGTPVTVSNVEAGDVSSDTSTDAVNGGQLFATNQTVSNLKDALDQGGVLDPATGASLAVTYADANKTGVSLGTAGVPVTVSNVSAGNVSSPSSTDAVNGGQLYATNLAVSDLTDALDNSGLIDPITGESLAVTYADANKTVVTLGTTGAPVTVSNVSAGDVSSPTSTDAVNGGQLHATNLAVSDLTDALDNSGLIDPITGETLAVTYTDANKTGVTLGTAGTPVTVSNVSAGDVSSATSTDAVSGGQLYATNQAISDLADVLDNSGLVDPITGDTLLAVTYADANKTGVTLGTAGMPVTVSNVSAGNVSSVTSTDAVNGGQLFTTNQTVGNLKDALDNSGLIDPITGESLAVTYADANKTGVSLGTAGMPVTVSNVGAGDVSSATSMDAVNGGQLYATNQAISDLTDALDNSGLIDPSTGISLAVTYDDASKDGVTLGGAGANAAVPLHNMATGTDDTDGVNVAQLTTGLNDLKTELTSGAINLKYIKVNSAKTQANATGTDAVAIGAQSGATAGNAVAIGMGARAANLDSVAIGVNSVANQNNVLSVGSLGKERKIIYVDDGDISSGSTDAVNGGQLFTLRKALEAIARTAGTNGTNGASAKDVLDPVAAVEGRSGNNVASLNGGDPEEFTAAAIGVFSFASGADAIAMGLHSHAGSSYSVALGYMTDTGADQEYSVAVGSRLHTRGSHAVALGTRVQANAEHALAVGSNDTSAIGRSSIAMGDGVKAHGDNSIAIGRNAIVMRNVIDALALGSEARVDAAAIGGVALGHGAVADRGNAISIGGGAVGTRQIIHVSAATEPTDAVNLAQLQEAMAAMRAEIQLLRSQLASRPAAQ